MGIGDQCRKRLVEFMRDRSRHLRHAQSARQTSQIILGHDEFLLRLSLVFNVNMHAVPAHDLPIGCKLRVTAYQKPAIASVSSTNASLNFEFSVHMAAPLPSSVRTASASSA